MKSDKARLNSSGILNRQKVVLYTCVLDTKPVNENVRRNGEYNEDYFITG